MDRLRVLLVLLLASLAPPALAEGFIQRQFDAFEASEIRFARSETNTPFTPIAFLGVSRYGEAEVEATDRGVALTYDVTKVSQGAGFPLVLGRRDVVLFGEYLAYADFELAGDVTRSFDVRTVGLPVGWLRQLGPDHQFAAFLMPMGHDNSLDAGGWTWQTMGGAFVRWDQRDDLWWAFGVFFDAGPDEDLYVPYVGASWRIDERWTLSALMPWPALLYAPTTDWLFRLGASPSGASWSVAPAAGDVTLNIDAWDFGIGAERRLARHLWAALEVGVGGLRGVRYSGSDLEAPDVDVGSSWFAKLNLRLRPSRGR